MRRINKLLILFVLLLTCRCNKLINSNNNKEKATLMVGYFFVNESNARPTCYEESSLQAYLAQCDGDLHAVQEFLRGEHDASPPSAQVAH